MAQIIERKDAEQHCRGSILLSNLALRNVIKYPAQYGISFSKESPLSTKDQSRLLLGDILCNEKTRDLLANRIHQDLLMIANGRIKDLESTSSSSDELDLIMPKSSQKVEETNGKIVTVYALAGSFVAYIFFSALYGIFRGKKNSKSTLIVP